MIKKQVYLILSNFQHLTYFHLAFSFGCFLSFFLEWIKGFLLTDTPAFSIRQLDSSHNLEKIHKQKIRVIRD